MKKVSIGVFGKIDILKVNLIDFQLNKSFKKLCLCTFEPVSFFLVWKQPETII